MLVKHWGHPKILKWCALPQRFTLGGQKRKENSMRRRKFIRNAAVAGTGLLVFRLAPRGLAQTVPGRIEIVMDEPLGTISPNIYGHFTGNLSGVIYDGIWVGDNSRVPNIGGIRKDLVDQR